MMERYFLGLITFVGLLSLSFIVGCGDPEGTERSDLVINDEV